MGSAEPGNLTWKQAVHMQLLDEFGTNSKSTSKSRNRTPFESETLGKVA